MIKVAIVEDHRMVREGIKLLLNEQEGIEIVAEFSNGKDWLLSLANQHYDVSLVDIDMPDISGLMALSEGLSIDKNIKVIMLTMHNDVFFFKEAFVKGARGYVLKDMTVTELYTAIDEVYKGNTYFSDDFLKSLAQNLNREQHSEKDSKNLISLNDQEHKLLNYICRGYTNKELADNLFLSVKTIESQKSKLMRKVKTKNNAGLIVWAIKNNVVEI
ncbi:MAG: response regulator transcription factor [Carboxylicivirga sp.]|jgi:DNA-binding NarL/FixJ family response regulator|nr:response regulator transcription factor [Carboxylicivirga sp.]MCT4643485.1 response regulator transcription factor [Carboxylicivirga sp.]